MARSPIRSALVSPRAATTIGGMLTSGWQTNGTFVVVAKPTSLSQVLVDAFLVKESFFPFWSIGSSREHRFRIGLQRSLTRESTNGQKLIEHRTAFVQSCPQAIRARVGLTKQRLTGHRLMGSLDRSMISWSAYPCEDQVNAQSQQPQVQSCRKRRG